LPENARSLFAVKVSPGRFGVFPRGEKPIGCMFCVYSNVETASRTSGFCA
jgi:hypothetical protein